MATWRSWTRTAAHLAVALTVVATTALGAACSKRCQSPEGCKRSCTCTDTERDISFSCNMTFICRQESKTCDELHDKSCGEICDTFAAFNACGQQCDNDEQCNLRCPCETEAGVPLICDQPFACDKERGVCEPNHAITTCELICQGCVI